MRELEYTVGCVVPVMGAEVYIGSLYSYPSKNDVPHHHHSCLELHYEADGKTEFLLNFTDTETIGLGEWILLGKNLYHKERAEADSSGYCLRLEILSAEKDSPFSAWAGPGWLRGGSEPEIGRIFEQIFEEIAEKRPGYIDAVQHFCALLLVRLVRETSSSAQNADKRRSFPIDVHTILDDYFDLVFTSAGERLSIGELADKLRVSTRHVSRILQREYGMTFSQKLNETRMKCAEDLLLHTDLPIPEVSAKCGMTAAYLTRCFKERFGITPIRYRKTHKSDMNF
ncbi:MAG: AraC family transcriptional regulator [Ruminococcaceae bacterium]|nr:AraC family transcriptional regulator [Oscillospiraceae bacterium]